MTDLSRTLCANQSHRRMIDPMSFRRWDRPFCIERVPAASPNPGTATGPTIIEADRAQGSAK